MTHVARQCEASARQPRGERTNWVGIGERDYSCWQNTSAPICLHAWWVNEIKSQTASEEHKMRRKELEKWKESYSVSASCGTLLLAPLSGVTGRAVSRLAIFYRARAIRSSTCWQQRPSWNLHSWPCACDCAAMYKYVQQAAATATFLFRAFSRTAN